MGEHTWLKLNDPDTKRCWHEIKYITCNVINIILSYTKGNIYMQPVIYFYIYIRGRSNQLHKGEPILFF